jgi:DNA-binding CsgD family transcriptional regulator
MGTAVTRPRLPRTEAAWLAHLELLAKLPYPGRVLMPSILAAVRSGFDAELGFFFWVTRDAGVLKPVALWAERSSGAIVEILRTRLVEIFENFPLQIQLDTDGDLIRQLQAMPGDEESWVYAEGLHPLGVHWGLSVPLLDDQGECRGFMYLYRAKSDGPFSDEDNWRLKRAREHLRQLGTQAPARLPPCPSRFRCAANFHFDAQGRMTARSALGLELLYLYQDLGEGLLNWNAEDMTALPAQARDIVAGMLVAARLGQPTRPVSYSVDLPTGRFDFHAETLTGLNGSGPVVAVRMCHHEPLDVAVARALLHAPYSLQEKRILVASTRAPSLNDLAEHLGITVGSLKVYINRLQAKAGLSSRQAIIERLLAEAGAA